MAVLSKSGIQLEPHQVVLRPLVTEKGTHQATRHGAYAFEVTMLATKEDIRKAISTLFGVRVAGVRTQRRAGKPRRTKTGEVQLQSWKKAIVVLHEDDRINLF